MKQTTEIVTTEIQIIPKETENMLFVVDFAKVVHNPMKYKIVKLTEEQMDQLD